MTEKQAVPIPSGPHIWVLTLSEAATAATSRAAIERLHEALPEDVRERSRIICLAGGYTLQALDDDDLRGLGLQRIEVHR